MRASVFAHLLMKALLDASVLLHATNNMPAACAASSSAPACGAHARAQAAPIDIESLTVSATGMAPPRKMPRLRTTSPTIRPAELSAPPRVQTRSSARADHAQEPDIVSAEAEPQAKGSPQRRSRRISRPPAHIQQPSRPRRSGRRAANDSARLDEITPIGDRAVDKADEEQLRVQPRAKLPDLPAQSSSSLHESSASSWNPQEEALEEVAEPVQVSPKHTKDEKVSAKHSAGESVSVPQPLDEKLLQAPSNQARNTATLGRSKKRNPRKRKLSDTGAPVKAGIPVCTEEIRYDDDPWFAEPGPSRQK